MYERACKHAVVHVSSRDPPLNKKEVFYSQILNKPNQICMCLNYAFDSIYSSADKKILKKQILFA